jgi:hypothetical protein
MNSIELFETPDWERLEAFELEIESNIIELTLEDYLHRRKLIKRLVKNFFEGKPLGLTEPLTDAPCYRLTNNEHWEYTQRHRSAIFKAFKNGKLVQGWILHDDYPEF